METQSSPRYRGRTGIFVVIVVVGGREMWKTLISPEFARIFCPRPLCDNLWQNFLTNVDNFFSPQKIIHFSPKFGGNMSLMVEADLTENRYVGERKTASQNSAFRRRRNKFQSMISNDMCIGNHSSRPESACRTGAVQAAIPTFGMRKSPTEYLTPSFPGLPDEGNTVGRIPKVLL